MFFLSERPFNKSEGSILGRGSQNRPRCTDQRTIQMDISSCRLLLFELIMLLGSCHRVVGSLILFHPHVAMKLQNHRTWLYQSVSVPMPQHAHRLRVHLLTPALHVA